MNKELIMVNSITYAIRGRDLLRSKGYKASLERTPQQLNRAGCGYSVVVEAGNANVAELILRDYGIKVLGRVSL